jgi:hypothetical protein
MKWISCLLYAMVNGAALAPALAEPLRSPGIDVNVLTAGPNYFPVYALDSYDPPVRLVHGDTRGGDFAASAYTGTGLGCVGPCGASLPGAVSNVELDASKGVGRAYSYSNILMSQSGASVALYDTLIAAPGASSVTFKLRAELSALSAIGAGNEARFFTGLQAYDAGAQAYELPIFGFGARLNESEFEGVIFTNTASTTLAAPVLLVERTVTVPFINGRLDLRWDLSAGVSGDPSGHALVSAGQSVYVGIIGDYSSVGGYSYLGYSAPVPEPSSLALLACGVLGLLTVGRRTFPGVKSCLQ